MMKQAFAGLMAGMTYLFGPPDKMMIFLSVLLVANFLYGLAVESENKKEYVASSLKRYAGYAGLMFIGHHMDQSQIFVSIGFTASVRFLLAIYMLAKEIRRFLTYLEHLGVETPKFLDIGLQQVENKTAKSEDEFKELSKRLQELEKEVQSKKNKSQHPTNDTNKRGENE